MKRTGRPIARGAYDGANTLRWDEDAIARRIVSELGALTTESIGYLLGVSRERVRQIEADALAKLNRMGAAGELRGMTDDVPVNGPLSAGGRDTITPMLIKRVLRHDGTDEETARVCGISRQAVWRIRNHSGRAA